MRLGIDGVADRGEFAEQLAWVAILEQRAVAAPADALDEGRDVGVEPQRQAVLQVLCACLVVSLDVRRAGKSVSVRVVLGGRRFIYITHHLFKLISPNRNTSC